MCAFIDVLRVKSYLSSYRCTLYYLTVEYRMFRQMFSVFSVNAHMHFLLCFSILQNFPGSYTMHGQCIINRGYRHFIILPVISETFIAKFFNYCMYTQGLEFTSVTSILLTRASIHDALLRSEAGMHPSAPTALVTVTDQMHARLRNAGRYLSAANWLLLYASVGPTALELRNYSYV